MQEITGLESFGSLMNDPEDTRWSRSRVSHQVTAVDREVTSPQ